MSLDKIPVLHKALRSPQRWNQYTYVAANPINSIDPTGNVILVLSAEEASEAQEELLALRESLQEAGAEEEAQLLQLEEVGGEIRITSGGVDLSSSDNPTVALVGSAINTETRIDLEITSADLSDAGGAKTISVGPRSDPDRITIQVNPAQLSSTVKSGSITAGPLQGTTIGLTYSTGTALVHELGHAYGYYAEGASRYPVFGQTNSTALRYENLHRILLADPRHPMLNRFPVERIRH